MLFIRKTLFLCVGVLPIVPAHAQKSLHAFVLNGTCKEPAGNMIYLGYTNNEGKSVQDSAVLSGGSFRFTGMINDPTFSTLTSSLGRTAGFKHQVFLFLEPANMSIAVDGDDFKKSLITGSKTQNEYADLQKRYDIIDKRWTVVLDTLRAISKRSNAQWQETKEWVMQPYNTERQEVESWFMKTYPASFVNPLLLIMSYHLNGDTLKKLYSALPESVRQSHFGKLLEEKFAHEKNGAPETMATGFSRTDINGQVVSLSNFRGKYVLIDFWASWCVPCRKGNPHLKELYARYKDKGFEVIGVSDDDRNITAWRKAVTADGLPWKQILRGTITDSKNNVDKRNDLHIAYNISSMPTQVLVDPLGKIIARYGGEGGQEHAAFDEKLQSIFK